MPTIPVYSSSPINASRPSGATPHTQGPEGSRGEHRESPKTSGIAPASHGPPTARPPPPAAAAGRPSLPVQTGMPQPTPAAPLSAAGAASPPAPQPGAVPGLPTPTGGAKYGGPPNAPESAQTTAVTAPPQVSYLPPVTSQPIQGRSSTAVATAPVSQGRGPYPTSLLEGDAAADYSHPPGYQQDVHAADMTSRQAAAHRPGMASVSGGDDQPGVWDVARKWAAAAGESLAQAGESLAAAENEVWKRINKD